jgi:hypothetical protein
MGRTIITAADVAAARQSRVRVDTGAVAGGVPNSGSVLPTADAESGSLAGPTRASTPVVEKKDTYTDRLVKYIPAEVVAVYLAVAGMIGDPNATAANRWALWLSFGIIAVLTPPYLRRVAMVSKKSQVVISTLAFVVWVYYLGGPFTTFGWYEGTGKMAALVVFTLFTFAAPIFEPQK